MIVVYTPDGERFEFEGATRFKTDEHNNLEILGGTASQPAPMGCFSETNWLRILVEDGDG